MGTNPSGSGSPKHVGFTELFLTVDARTLACTRVALAALLLVDLAKRASSMSVWYTDDGLLPRFAVQPIAPFGWSFFWSLGSSHQVALAFTAIAVVYVALLVGFLTKVAQVLALVCAISLQHRVQPLASGGEIVLCLLCWWTLFLPLGRVFSVDARLARRRARGRGTPESPVAPVVSIAVLGATIQLAAIYLFNAVHKDGATWTNGDAIHYVLWLDRVNTPVALWVREWIPLWAVRGLSWGTLLVEGVLPFLILSPFWRPWTRRIAIVLIVALHTGISTFLNVGPFSMAMIAFSTLLLSREDWEALERRLGRPPAPASSAPPSLVAGLRRPATALAEAGALSLLAVVVFQLLLENRSVPSWLRPPPSRTVGLVASAARLGENWGMFSPDVGTGEMALVVDAITADGRHVDPFNLSAVGESHPERRVLPKQIGYDVFSHHYVLRMPEFASLHPAFDYWVFGHHRRTGNEADRIVRYRAYLLYRPSPWPGRRRTPPTQVRDFLHGSR